MTESLAFYVELSRMATNPVVSSPILQPINTLPTNTNPYPHNPTPTPHPISAGAVDWLGLVQFIGSTYPYVPICTPLIQESWYSFQCKNLVFWKALMWQFSLFLRYSGSGVFCTAKLSTRYSNFGRSKNKAWLIPDYYRLLPCNFFGNKTLHKRSRILVEDRAAWSLPCLGEQRQQKALLLLLLLLTVAVEEVS